MLNKNKNKSSREKGFTLVELLAVIVILAIILVIAVPKVMSVIEDSKKATLESTAKMIASQAEKQKVQNTVLGNTDAITCDSVAKINKTDYASCDVDFENDTAKVTIKGSGKFNGLWVCEGTKAEAIATNEGCLSSIEVKHPLFLKGQTLTPDKFEVRYIDNDGNTRILEDGGRYTPYEGIEGKTITSPNWPENYPSNMTEKNNYWEYSYEGADGIQITFDETSKTRSIADSIYIYDKDGNMLYTLNNDEFAGKTYVVVGDYVKVTMKSITREKGFSAVIKPARNVPAEYTVSPSVVPNVDENFDITITLKNKNKSKKINTNVKHDIEDFFESIEPFEGVLKNGLKKTTATYTNVDGEEVSVDAGIRYVGNLTGFDLVKNKVYFNCEPTDGTNAYGSENYNYSSSCEIWRIIGVLEVEDENGDTASRIKIINTNSTFKASWDSSANEINTGWGINQWGPSTLINGSEYAGADLMQLLNGYYIEKNNPEIPVANKKECKYNNNFEQSGFTQTCDTTANPLSNLNMKPLTLIALRMIDEAVWYTYATDTNTASTAYLRERGIISKYTGCLNTEIKECEKDNVIRDNEWTGLIGLMSLSDIEYAKNWLFHGSNPWSITPYAYLSISASHVWLSFSSGSSNPAGYANDVWPTTYLSSNVQIVGGDGNEVPYKLSMES